MNYTFCAKTDRGRVRQGNEDCFVFDASARLCIVADGMGGHKAGEIASSLAVTSIKAELGPWLLQAGKHPGTQAIKHAIELAVLNVNRSIYCAALANPAYSGMGTTLVLGVFQRDRLVLGHIGDSRCYRWRRGDLVQLTKDHSVMQEQLDAGWLTPDQAAQAPGKNLITRALGIASVVTPEISEHAVQAGDLYLMCSDGLSNMVDEAGIAQVLRSGAALRQITAELVSLANDNGGQDNITVMLTQATLSSDKRGLVSRLFDN